jgi:hypothetical protein
VARGDDGRHVTRDDLTSLGPEAFVCGHVSRSLVRGRHFQKFKIPIYVTLFTNGK